jgi:hypothetical protein
MLLFPLIPVLLVLIHNFPFELRFEPSASTLEVARERVHSLESAEKDAENTAIRQSNGLV